MKVNQQGIKNNMWKLASIVGLGLLCFVVITAVKSKKESYSSRLNINIKDYEEGKSMLMKEDIQLIIERVFGYDLVGVAIDEIKLLEVENLLENVPMIKEANVYIDALNKINVEVNQREPVLRVIDKFDTSYYLDEAGVRLPISKHFTPRILIANGNITEYNDEEFKAETGILFDLYKLALLIREDDFLKAQIEQLYVNKKGEIEMSPKVGKQNILFGNFNKAETKLENLKIFYRDGMPYKGWNTYMTIDLRFDGQVVGKKHYLEKS